MPFGNHASNLSTVTQRVSARTRTPPPPPPLHHMIESVHNMYKFSVRICARRRNNNVAISFWAIIWVVTSLAHSLAHSPCAHADVAAEELLGERQRHHAARARRLLDDALRVQQVDAAAAAAETHTAPRRENIIINFHNKHKLNS